MKFCDADACPACAQLEGTQACLRQKAKFCSWLASTASGEPEGALSRDLIEEANAMEREQMLKAAG